MSNERNIIICGGSLAGLSAAIRLKQLGHSPLVLEKSHFPREKLCGEFLGPDSFPELQTLGLFDQVMEKAYGPIEKVYFYNQQGQEINVKLGLVNAAFPYAVAIPRFILDKLMQDYARQLGIDIEEGVKVLSPLNFKKEVFVLSGQTYESKLSYQSKYFLDATGRQGGLHLANYHQKNKKSSKTLAIQCHLDLSFPDKHLRMFLFPGGYGGLQPISTDTSNLCLLLRLAPEKIVSQHPKMLVQSSFAQNPVAARLLSMVDMTGPFQTTANLNLNVEPKGLLQIGDAKLTVDPFTGSGMTQALQTGILAAEVLDEGLRNNWPYAKVCKQYEERYNSYFALRLKALQCFRPWLFSDSLQKWSWSTLKLISPVLAKIVR